MYLYPLIRKQCQSEVLDLCTYKQYQSKSDKSYKVCFIHTYVLLYLYVSNTKAKYSVLCTYKQYQSKR